MVDVSMRSPFFSNKKYDIIEVVEKLSVVIETTARSAV
jgi:hypothetical protein